MKTERHKGFTPLETRNQRFLTATKGGLSLTGFTLIEVLTALTVIAILIGILLPALGEVKKIAKNTLQRAQITSIEIGINTYKLDEDFGDYPPAGKTSAAVSGYCASQILTEAMLGPDLLGVDPCSGYEPYDPAYYPFDPNGRKGPYLDRTHVGVFEPNDIFGSATVSAGTLSAKGYLICDVFGVLKKKIGKKTYKIGTPVLYYKANTAKTNISAALFADRIYNCLDNEELIKLGTIPKKKLHHFAPLYEEGTTPVLTGQDIFYNYITDPMVTGSKYPVRADSFFLISAGNDGLYGTSDDICNFEPNIE